MAALRGRAAAVVVAVGVAAVLAPAARVAAQAIDLVEAVGPRASIAVDGQPATLQIAAWDRDAVQVRTHGDLRLDAVVRRHADGLDIFIDRRGPTDAGRGTRDTVYIRIPRRASLRAGSYWGAVHVTGVEGVVRLETYFEAVSYRGAAPELDVTAFHEDADIETAGPAAITVTSGGGDVRVRAAGGRVRVETVRGDIAVAGSRPVEQAELISTQGSVVFDAPFESDALIVLDSYSGEVEAAVHPGASARISLEAYAGTIRNELGESSRPGADPLRRRVVEVTVGEGGARLAAKSVRGDVRLRARDGPRATPEPIR